jgi:hypothetical protein
MSGAHRQTDQDPVRSALKSVRWLLGLLGFIAVSLAIVGIPVYLLTRGGRFLPIFTITMQGVIVVVLARRLVRDVHRDRTPSAVVMADWIGDSAYVTAWVALLVVSIAQHQGLMHGAFQYAMFGIMGLFLVGLPVYWFVGGEQRAVLALTARAVAGRWPWSAGG